MDEYREDFERWLYACDQELAQVETPDWLTSDTTGYQIWVDTIIPLCIDEQAQEQPRDVDTLFLVVGTSLRPLLFSICWYRPRCVVLLYTEEAEDQEGYESYRTLHDFLQQHMPSVKIHSQKIGLTDSVSTFLTIRAHIQAHKLERTDCVLDITGGKKSMVSAAFFVGVEYKIRISYIDTRYLPQWNRPDPLSMRPIFLQNPASVLALSATRNFHSHMKGHAFARAKEDLEEIESILGTDTNLCDFDYDKAKHCTLAMFHHHKRDYKTAVSELEKCGLGTQVPELWRDIQTVKLKERTEKFYHTRPFFGYLCDQYYWLNYVRNEYSKEELFLQTYVLAELVVNWFFYKQCKAEHIEAIEERIDKYDVLTLAIPAKLTLLKEGSVTYAFRVKKEHGSGKEMIIGSLMLDDLTFSSWPSFASLYSRFGSLRNKIAHGVGTVDDDTIAALSVMVRDVIVDAARFNPTDEVLDEDLRPNSTRPKSKEWYRTVEKWLNAPDPLLFSIPELQKYYAR